MSEALESEVTAALDVLSERERAVFDERCDGMTFRAIAAAHNISREVARQLVARSVRKLRRRIQWTRSTEV